MTDLAVELTKAELVKALLSAGIMNQRVREALVKSHRIEMDIMTHAHHWDKCEICQTLALKTEDAEGELQKALAKAWDEGWKAIVDEFDMHGDDWFPEEDKDSLPKNPYKEAK